jgi:hypothetical protein
MAERYNSTNKLPKAVNYYPYLANVAVFKLIGCGIWAQLVSS